jgi:hypothetical protein
MIAALRPFISPVRQAPTKGWPLSAVVLYLFV